MIGDFKDGDGEDKSHVWVMGFVVSAAVDVVILPTLRRGKRRWEENSSFKGFMFV